MAFDNYTEVFDSSLDGVCRKATTMGHPQIYYKGAYFKHYVRASHNLIYAYCKARCPDCAPTNYQETPAYQVCVTYRKVDGVTSRKAFTYNVGQCPKPCDTCAMKVGNPVEVANFTKLVTARDWSSPVDPRFRIERSYRSDMAFRLRFNGETTHPYDLFANIWQRTFSDTIYTTTVNPYDPSDTREWYRYESGDGKIIYFLRSDPSQTLGGEGYSFSRSYTWAKITSPDGVLRSFYLNLSPYVLSGVTWPDGYSIAMDRFAPYYMHHIGMTDNKGNKAVYVFNQNVVPGADRHLISEIILSRQTASGYVETGRLLYGYSTLTYPAIGANGNVEPSVPGVALPRSPVITSVDYRAAGSATASPVWRYTYATALPEGAQQPDGSLTPVLFNPVTVPMLTSISDGGSVPYAEYTYRDYGFDSSGRYIGLGVATEKFAGDTEVTGFDRSSTGDLHVMTNPKGLSTSYAFAQLGRNRKVVAVTGEPGPGSLGTEIATTYDSSTETVTETVNRNGARTTYVRDPKGRILSVTEDVDGAAPRVTSNTWHATFRLPLTRVTSGLTETFSYDVNGLLLSYSQTDTKTGSPTNGQVRTWSYGYTTLGSGLKVLTTLNGPGLTADGINDVTAYTYTATGDLVTATDPNGLVTTVLARNTFGQPTLVEQPDKTQWTFAYDAEGRLISSGYAGPGQTPLLSGFQYNVSDQITAYTNSRGETWTFSYNAARRLTTSTSPTGDTVTYTYDAAGNVTREEYSNGAGPVTFWEGTDFDGLNRVLRSIGAMGQEWDYAHDVEDNLASLTDPLDHTTSHAYDPLNRLISTVDRENHTTGLEYDAHDRLTEYTDPRTIETDFTYSGFGEVVTEVSADRGTISYTYDRRGLVTSRTDGRGVTVSYAYDNAGRLTLIDYPTGGIGDIAFTWDQPFAGAGVHDNKGHMGRIDDGTIRMDFGHTVTATGPRVTMTALYPAGRSYTVIEETDFEGNATRTVYPSGREVLVDHDDDNRPVRIRVREGATYTILLDQMTYVPNGPLASALYGDGYSQTRTYDLSYRLTGIVDALGATRLRDVSYGYEGRDNIASIADALVPGNSESFGYTPRESLASASGPYGALGFTYDGVGNRLTSTLGAATDGYVYPATSNRLTTINLATGGSRGFSYDGAGNVIAEARPGGSYGYTYNAAGRMSEFRINGFLQASYKYDAMGRQAIRTLTSPTPVTIHSVFDSEGRRIAEYDETSGALIREYVWNGWDPVAVIEGGVVSFVRADHIGRPVFATNAAGTKVWSATYLPFGGVQTSTGALPAARFPGQWFQSESGLHQNWMRDYDPTTGRYLQTDPLGLVDGASVYGYVKQSPMRFIDPTGEAIPALLVGGAIVGGILGYYQTGCWQGALVGAAFGGLGAYTFGGTVVTAGWGAATAGAGAVFTGVFTEDTCGCTPQPALDLKAIILIMIGGGFGGALGGPMGSSVGDTLVGGNGPLSSGIEGIVGGISTGLGGSVGAGMGQ